MQARFVRVKLLGDAPPPSSHIVCACGLSYIGCQVVVFRRFCMVLLFCKTLEAVFFRNFVTERSCFVARGKPELATVGGIR